MPKCLRLIFSICLLLGVGLTYAQDDRKAQLQRLKVRLQDEIELANKILSQTRQDQSSSMGRINTVEQKLKLRQDLIRTMDREIEFLDRDIADLGEDVDSLQRRIEVLKTEYASMIRQAYKSQNRYSRLMFLLSSRDFNQALRRLAYLKQYSEFRRRQVEEILLKQEELSQAIVELDQQKQKKTALKQQMERERGKLEDERKEQQKNISELQSREKEISKQLKEKMAEAKKLENEIQRIIAEEIRREKERAIRRQIEDEARQVGLVEGQDFSRNTNNDQLRKLIEAKKAELRAANKPVAESPVTYGLTPEATRLAANFAANRGRLPWPVERGLVVSRFGPQQHPIAKGVTINNNGIDLATEPGSSARVVFDGEVSQIMRVPGEAIAVMVKHGNYFTVYYYLSNVTVKSGDKVSRGQVLGTVHKSSREDQHTLHFEVWKETQVMDPLPWLAGK